MNTCPYCGVATQPGDNFCRNCGNRLPPTTPSSSQSARLIILGESGKDWLEFPLEKPRVSIGRAASSDLIVTKDHFFSPKNWIEEEELLLTIQANFACEFTTV